MMTTLNGFKAHFRNYSMQTLSSDDTNVFSVNNSILFTLQQESNMFFYARVLFSVKAGFRRHFWLSASSDRDRMAIHYASGGT